MNVNRLVFPGFWFGKTKEEEALALARKGVGGFCLYGGTKQQVADLVHRLRAASPLPRILIAADYEDGLGRWLPDIELLPSNMALGASQKEELAFEKGLITASQARILGVDWVFAPVVDLANNPDNPIINTRSFGKDPKLVVRMARAFMKGLSQGGALNSLKHFPGHGNTSVDSHLAMPVMNDTKNGFLTALYPFQSLLDEADSVMIGHLLVPMIDDKLPASLSPRLIKELLQKRMGFKKCVCTDALSMKALGDEKQAALQALLAGAHLLLVPEKPLELLEFLEKNPIKEEIIKEAERQLNALCAQADEISSNASTCPPVSDFILRASRSCLTYTGTLPPLDPGETVHYLSIGNDENLSETTFLNTLTAHGITALPFEDRAEFLVILLWRRYQAFKGKIGLSEEETTQIEQASLQAKHTVLICLSNPWVASSLQAQAKIFTFSPAPLFQQTAAEVLLGKLKPGGTLPVDL